MIRSLIKKALGIDGSADPGTVEQGARESSPPPAKHEAGMIQMGKKPGHHEPGVMSRAQGESVQDFVQKVVSEGDVVLFMKGTPSAPACGFSARAVDIISRTGARLTAVNVLEDGDVREGVKKLNDWPTIPQIFIKGEFVGGSDILAQMASNGDLHKLMKDKGILA